MTLTYLTTYMLYNEHHVPTLENNVKCIEIQALIKILCKYSRILLKRVYNFVLLTYK